jgi:hypothetical protein
MKPNLYLLKTELTKIEKILDTEVSDLDFDILNAQANDIQAQILALESELQVLKMTQRIIELDTAMCLHRDGKMVELVETFGSQFADDYVITDNFQVRSYAKNPHNQNMTNMWQFADHRACRNKVFQLVYWRVYEAYIRNNLDPKVG